MDSSKMISEQLFLLIPMLYNQIIRPIEGALRAKISPLQFYALMALKREGCMTMISSVSERTTSVSTPSRSTARTQSWIRSLIRITRRSCA